MSHTLDHTVSGLGSVPAARVLVAEHLDATAIDRQRRDDIVLIVQELLTNGFLHGHAFSVEMSLHVDPEAVCVVVSHHATRTPDVPAHPAPMPAPSVASGRGLAIVDRLSARRESHVIDDSFVVTCWVDLA